MKNDDEKFIRLMFSDKSLEYSAFTLRYIIKQRHFVLEGYELLGYERLTFAFSS